MNCYLNVQSLYTLINDHDKVFFVTLEPSKKIPGKKLFHNFSILSAVELKKVEHKKTILEYLNKSIEDSDGSAAMCFMPRHGLRIIKGKKVLDLVICFQCASASVYSTLSTSVRIKGKRDTFDKVAKELQMEITKN